MTRLSEVSSLLIDMDGILSGSSSRAGVEAFGPDFIFEDLAGLLDARQSEIEGDVRTDF